MLLFIVLGIIILCICFVGCFIYFKRKRNYEKTMSDKVNKLEQKIQAMQSTEIKNRSNTTLINSINNTFNGGEQDGQVMGIQIVNPRLTVTAQNTDGDQVDEKLNIYGDFLFTTSIATCMTAQDTCVNPT
eukprot:187608_1